MQWLSSQEDFTVASQNFLALAIECSSEVEECAQSKNTGRDEPGQQKWAVPQPRPGEPFMKGLQGWRPHQEDLLE